MGSKNRIAKYILPIILKDRKEGQYYVEPFCGGCNLIDKVDGNRIGADTNKYLIALLLKLQEGWVPPSISKEEYLLIKDNKENYPDYLLGYVGFQLTFSSQWFGSYRRDNTGLRDYSKEAIKNIVAQTPNLKSIIFKESSYNELEIPPNSIIYCDPPYKDTAGYLDNVIDYLHFYQWCRDRKAEGHTIFISEYAMPDDFICIWQKEQVSSLAKDTGSKRAIEKLFTL
jgi:DNA adenine methylase